MSFESILSKKELDNICCCKQFTVSYQKKQKHSNIPISDLSFEEINASLDTIESNHEEDIDNLMNNSDTEFVDCLLLEG